MFIRKSVFIVALLLPLVALAQLEVNSFFGDHMVLQRGQSVPVWGQADPGEEVTVRFRDASVTTQAGEDGKWMLKLPRQSVGEVAPLRILSGDEEVVLEDVLVGEVWLCSGQSNMEWPVEKSVNAEKEIAAADYPSIRLFDIPRRFSPTPLERIEGKWEICSPETVPEFSAVAYYFGRELRGELDVPIGLVSSAWGGTPAEAWTPLDTLKSRPEYKGIVAEYRRMTQLLADNPGLGERLQKEYDAFMEQVNSLGESPPVPEESCFDPDSPIDGAQFVEPGIDFFSETDGMVQVRTLFALDQEQAKRKGARIRLGQIDNFDTTWINGVKVGRTASEVDDPRLHYRDYEIPDGILKPGRNVVLIQIVDTYKNAQFGKDIDHPEIRWPGGDVLALPDRWEMKVVVDAGPRPETLDRKAKNTGSYLYNGMIAPLLPAAFRGAIWYQGESNAGRAVQYRILFPDMIRSWRENWNRGDFPFYFVQLANYRKRNPEPEEHGWAELREAQRQTLSLPNTGMAVAIDIGDAKDIHPRNKQDVGKRLALWALSGTYDFTEPGGFLSRIPLIGGLFRKPITCSGPLFREAMVEDGQIRLRFDHVDGGLRARDGGELKGFAIAEEGGPFKWAEARLDGDEVVVSHPEMDAPKVVRYAWATNPEAMLVNAAGLPASPFRTDTRPLTTEE